MSKPTTTLTVQVSGMTCGHCVAAVTEELSAIEQVDDVRVELSTGQVELDVTGPVGADTLAAAIDEAGYTLVDGASR